MEMFLNPFKARPDPFTCAIVSAGGYGEIAEPEKEHIQEVSATVEIDPEDFRECYKAVYKAWKIIKQIKGYQSPPAFTMKKRETGEESCRNFICYAVWYFVEEVSNGTERHVLLIQESFAMKYDRALSNGKI